MIVKIKEHHRRQPAYIYIRQSTLGQVRHHRESTERQYGFRNRAMELGWKPAKIRTLDRDMGLSGSQMTNREDFKTLVADVSMGQVGAVFSLEASRLARSSLDWQRLVELCGLTATLVIDEDGIYDPSDFNDALLLGIKGTIAQAELHYIRARLLGGRINKAQKGELRIPLPVGYCYDESGRIVFDPDQEVQGAVRLVFEYFRKTGSGYGVVDEFNQQGLLFPRRTNGGVWDGNLMWGRIYDERVTSILRHPCYAGAYAYGRRCIAKELSRKGEVRTRTRKVPMDKWQVNIKDHHEGYITWEEYLKNCEKLENNRTNGKTTMLSGPSREGRCLLQGLLLCSRCGRKISPRYGGEGGKYPTYACLGGRWEGRRSKGCFSIPQNVLDSAVSRRVLEVLQPVQIDIAIQAMLELEARDESVAQQWRMRIERADYEAQLAEKRYQEVDPLNRLVADTLERRWNEALEKLEELKQQYSEFQKKELRVATAEQKAKVRALAQDFPRVWNAPSTHIKDKKRMLRLLIKDITIERVAEPRQAIVHIRWHGGACEDIVVDVPPTMADRLRYTREFVDKIRTLAQTLFDDQIAEYLNQEGCKSATGKPFTASKVKTIRHCHHILAPERKYPGYLTVKQISVKFEVSKDVIYYLIRRKTIKAHKFPKSRCAWIKCNAETENALREWIRNSPKIQKQRRQRFIENFSVKNEQPS